MKTQSIFLFLATFISLQSFAFTINPARLELSPSGKTMSGVIQVNNESAEEAQVSIYMLERHHDEHGVEVRKQFELKKNFLILPANLTLKPKSSASVRVVYIGPKNPESEKGYRLIFSGTKARPLMRSKKDGISASVDVALSYAASVWVTPKDAKSEVRFEGLKSAGDNTFVILKNAGNRRSFVPKGSLKFSDKKTDAKVGPIKRPVQEFKELEEPIMAGETRHVKMPKDLKIDQKTLKVEFGE